MTQRLAIALTLAFVACMAAAPARADETCVGCHRGHFRPQLQAPALAQPQSIHGQNDVTCTSCHGGRGDVASASAHDAAAGFIAKPPRAEIAGVCLECHDEDDAAGYPDSGHARAVAAGSLEAPTCVDCHGAHSIGVPGGSGVAMDPVATCGSCHGDSETMAESELPTDQEAQYRQSVHGQAWAAGSEDAPTCIACHDPHAFRSATDAVDACGRCHEDLLEAFASGPHADAFERLGFPDCAACHGSHEIRRADVSLFDEGHLGACQRCHAEGQTVFDSVRRIARAVADAEAPGGRPADEHALRLAVHALDVVEVERLASLRVADELDVPGEGSDVDGSSRFAVASGLFFLVVLGAGAFWWRRRGES